MLWFLYFVKKQQQYIYFISEANSSVLEWLYPRVQGIMTIQAMAKGVSNNDMERPPHL